MKKTLAFIQRNDTRFAVGDFYPVLSVFSHHDLGTTTSPFLLLDHLGPSILPAKTNKKGVNEHPHRGFETVTLMFDGELEHQDTTGGGGIITKGDVQWMTAGAGVIHREHFSPEFREKGGRFEMIQLWVNLPAKDKLVPARYQSLRSSHIPVLPLPDNSGQVRVIAGQYQTAIGPAQTYSHIQMLDVMIHVGHTVTLPAQHGDTTLVYLRVGKINLSGTSELLEEQGLAVFSSLGDDLELTAITETHLLLLNGTPLNEPIMAHGPFVMNSYGQIIASYDAFKSGNFGQSDG